MVSLEPGDFLYQSDQELFLAMIEENDESYVFAVHGWREIDKDRVEEYIEDDKSRIHREEKIERLVEEEADDDTKEKFEMLQELFDAYEDTDISDDGPQSDFSLDET